LFLLRPRCQQGCILEKCSDQDTTDLEKALAFLKKRLDHTGPVFITGAFGGRHDQVLGINNVLFTEHGSFERILLIADGNLAELIPPGRTVYHCHPVLQSVGNHCGLFPLGQPCRAVKTTGFKWNLDGQGMRFGGLVSQCNVLAAQTLTIETTDPLLLTTECTVV